MNTWLLLSILAPVCWAISNALDTAVRRHFVKSDMVAVWFLAATRLPLIIALFAIFGFNWPEAANLFWMLFAGVLWIVPFVLYYRAVAEEEIGRIVLLMQMNSLFVFTLAWLLINEKLTAVQGFAFGLLLVGGIFASIRRIQSKWHMSAAFWFMFCAGIAWALSDVLFKKYAPSFGDFGSAASWYLLGSFLPAFFPFFFKKQRHELAEHLGKLSARGWGLLSMNQLFGISGSIIFAYALTLGKASLTIVIIAIQPLLAILWTYLLAPFIPEVEKEPLNREAIFFKSISFLLILAGLIVLSLQ